MVIPDSLRGILLKDLHTEPLGIVQMKQLARKNMWWPKLAKEIEETVKACTSCQEAVNARSALRHVFSSLGLPEHIVTDNCSQFTSMEFQIMDF